MSPTRATSASILAQLTCLTWHRFHSMLCPGFPKSHVPKQLHAWVTRGPLVCSLQGNTCSSALEHHPQHMRRMRRGLVQPRSWTPVPEVALSQQHTAASIRKGQLWATCFGIATNTELSGWKTIPKCGGGGVLLCSCNSMLHEMEKLYREKIYCFPVISTNSYHSLFGHSTALTHP